MNPTPLPLSSRGAEVLLRAQLAELLSAEDLTRLSAESTQAGSLDAAVVKVLRRGLERRKAARGRK